MKYAYFFIALALLSSCNPNSKKSKSDESAIASDSLTDKEAAYFKTRDAYVEQFKPFEKSSYSDSLSKAHSEALLDLEIRLQEILKDSRYTGHGKINLETLIPSMGFGMMDGLWFEKDSMRIFYTSKNLFFKNFNVSELTPEVFAIVYQNAFFDNAGVESYFTTKISSSKNIEAYGTVGLVTQMDGNFPPNNLFVFVSTDKFVYLIVKEVSGKIKDLPHCKAIGDSINAEAKKYGQHYRASNLRDTAALNKQFKLEKVAFNKYLMCYQKELPSDPQFAAIQKQLESMVKYLEP
jgi:hypothetical protein